MEEYGKIKEDINFFEVTIKLPSGETKKIKAYSEWELIEKAKRLFGVDINPRPRTNRGRPLGSKTLAPRQFTGKSIQDLLGKACIATSVGAHLGNIDLMEIAASELQKRLTAPVLYNEYTGQLSHSYVISIIHNRRLVRQIFSKHKTDVKYGPLGGRYAFIINKRHEPSAFIYKNRKKGKKYKQKKFLMKDGKYIRYLKKLETKNGYYGRTSFSAKRTDYAPGYMSGSDGRIRSAIVLENVAPYSAAVQSSYGMNFNADTGKRHAGQRYAVLRRAAPELKKRGYNLILSVTKKTLKEAGFKVK